MVASRLRSTTSSISRHPCSSIAWRSPSRRVPTARASTGSSAASRRASGERMAQAASVSEQELDSTRRAVGEAHTLAATIPRLILEARRVAATVIHGLHGRRRAGSGENFWQYRRFVSGEPAQRVDWRRSARDDHLYVREQEWEAAHTIWLWPDRSASMAFASKDARDSKLE